MSKIKELIATAKLGYLDKFEWYTKVFAPKVAKYKYIYKEVEKLTGVPAGFLACIHARENGPDVGLFRAYLGNGQPLNRVTTIVPKGRGPFKDWVAGAVDAISLVKLDKVTNWTLKTAIVEWEKYNGLGYQKRGKLSPYVWSGTQHGVGTGHFTRDGSYSPKAVDANIGCFALYKTLVALDKDFAIDDEVLVEEVKVENIFTAFLNWLKGLFAKTAAPIVKSINEKIYEIAYGELGVSELKGGSHNARILEYHGTTGGYKDDETAWCGSFVSWVLLQAGLSTLGVKGASARAWLEYGFKTDAPKRGDIAVFWRESRTSWKGHVGFVVSVNTTHVKLLSGNDDNTVQIDDYPISMLLGYRTYEQA